MFPFSSAFVVVLFWLTFKSVVFVFGVHLTIYELVLGAVFGLRKDPPHRFLNKAAPRVCHTAIRHLARPDSQWFIKDRQMVAKARSRSGAPSACHCSRGSPRCRLARQEW